MKKLPMLYKRTELGQVQQWQIVIENNTFFVQEGIKNGTITIGKPTKCFGKNTEKSNSTTDEEQALKQAQAKWQKKIDSGYFENESEIDKVKFFEPQLAHKYLDRKDEIKWPVLCSVKIDGARMIVNKNGAWTRNGKAYVSVPHIYKTLQPLFKIHADWTIDGEGYTEDIPFEQVMSLIKKTKPTQEDLNESEKLVKYYIFDGITSDINKGFEDRFTEIKDEIKKLIGNDPHLIFVECEKAYNHNDIQSLHDKYVSQGWEGLMVRIMGSKYEHKRSKNLLKYKEFQDEEFEILDIIEGQGQRSGMAGKLVIKLPDGKTQESGIKGGETYYKELLKNKKSYISKLATIRYQNKTNDNKLRFPVAVDIDRTV